MNLNVGVLESTILPLPSNHSAIENDKAIAHCPSQQVQVFVSFLFILFEGEPE